MEEMKWCNKGQHFQPRSNFAKAARERDGLQSKCKDCNKAYRELNRERITSYHMEYHYSHRDRLLELKRERWHATKEDRAEIRREQVKAYYWKHRARLLAKAKSPESKRRMADYYRRNREAIIKHVVARESADRTAANLRGHRYRARRRDAQGGFAKSEWLAKCEYWGWRCYLCGSSVTKKTVHIEHRKPLSRGGSNWLANCAPSCPSCNHSKNIKTEVEYKSLRNELSSLMLHA
jgi:5-methylcytosine-specific restriction endonuclease McrA